MGRRSNSIRSIRKVISSQLSEKNVIDHGGATVTSEILVDTFPSVA